MTDSKKVWRFVQRVLETELEDKLNEFSNEGYQVYRLIRYNFDVDELDSDDDGARFDIIFFDPVLMAGRSTQALNHLIAGIGGAPTK